MAEGARLESVYTETYRGFESLPHRQILYQRRPRTSFLLPKILYKQAFTVQVSPSKSNEFQDLSM